MQYQHFSMDNRQQLVFVSVRSAAYFWPEVRLTTLLVCLHLKKMALDWLSSALLPYWPISCSVAQHHTTVASDRVAGEVTGGRRGPQIWICDLMYALFL